MDIKSVFSVNNSTSGHILNGAGQKTVSDALSLFPNQKVKLEGFLVNNEFKPVDLRSHWERTQFRKEKQ